MTEDKNIRDAQYRKGLSIAFFNATNAAIELVKDHSGLDPKKKMEMIVEWRDWFIKEHAEYYAQTIAKIGKNYKPEDTIAKLMATNSMEELKTCWFSLSQDERKDEQIFAVLKERKEYHETVR